MTSLDALIRKSARAYRSDFGGDAADALAQLRAARELQGELEVLELEIAHDARDVGASWEDLREAADLGSRSAAQTRYGAASVEERRAGIRKRSARPRVEAPEPPGISVAEAAERLGVTEATVRNRIKSGAIAATEYQRGKRTSFRIDPDSLTT